MKVMHPHSTDGKSDYLTLETQCLALDARLNILERTESLKNLETIKQAQNTLLKLLYDAQEIHEQLTPSAKANASLNRFLNHASTFITHHFHDLAPSRSEKSHNSQSSELPPMPATGLLEQLLTRAEFLNHKDLQIAVHNATIAAINEQMKIASTENKVAFKLIYDFMKAGEHLSFPKMTHAGIAIELISYLNHQRFVHQSGNVCGMAVIVSALIKYKPILFTKMALSLATTGAIQKPFTKPYAAHRSTTANEMRLNIALMHTLRHNTNKFGYTFYTRKGPFFSELYSGVTRPKCVVSLLEQLGFYVSRDETYLVNNNQQPLGKPHRFILGGIYSKKHITTPPQARNTINNIIDSLQNNGSLIALLDPSFVIALMYPEQIAKPVLQNMSVLGVHIDHWVNIYKMEIDKSDPSYIHFEMETYGEKSTFTTNIGTFLKSYRGAIFFSNQDSITPQLHAMTTKLTDVPDSSIELTGI